MHCLFGILVCAARPGKCNAMAEGSPAAAYRYAHSDWHWQPGAALSGRRHRDGSERLRLTVLSCG